MWRTSCRTAHRTRNELVLEADHATNTQINADAFSRVSATFLRPPDRMTVIRAGYLLLHFYIEAGFIIGFGFNYFL